MGMDWVGGTIRIYQLRRRLPVPPQYSLISYNCCLISILLDLISLWKSLNPL